MATAGVVFSVIFMVLQLVPIAGLSDDLAVLIYVLHRVWGDVSEEVKAKAKAKLSQWFDDDEIVDAEEVFEQEPSDTPV